METLSYCQLMQHCGELEAQVRQLAAENVAILQDRAVIIEAFDSTCVDIGMRRGEMAENYPVPVVANTDAILASLRAEGVEMLLEWLPPYYTARADIENYIAQLRSQSEQVKKKKGGGGCNRESK